MNNLEHFIELVHSNKHFNQLSKYNIIRLVWEYNKFGQKYPHAVLFDDLWFYNVAAPKHLSYHLEYKNLNHFLEDITYLDDLQREELKLLLV